MDEAFAQEMRDGYALSEPALTIGMPFLGTETVQGVPVQVAQSMVNRHGLIAGATGTGKTKTLQVLVGQLSKAGVPVFVADVKGDLTGLGAAGDASDPKVQARCQQLGIAYEPSAHPIELLSLSGKLGAQVRATVHSFGPLLLSKVLGLNDTQTSVMSLVFKYCDDEHLPLLDLEDLGSTLRYLGSDEGKAAVAAYGGIATSTLGVIQRSMHHLGAAGCRAVLRRARVRRRRPAPNERGRRGRRPRARAVRCDGQAGAVLDVHALAVGPALRELAGGR